MVVPLIPILIGAGMAAGTAGSLYSGHYNRKSLYEQKKIYDAEYNQYKLAKEQYKKNVGRKIKQPFSFDYQMEQNRARYRQTENAVKSSWGGSISSVGYGSAGMAGLYGRANPYQSGGGGYEKWGGMYGDAPGKNLYNIGKGKKWL